MKITAIDNVPDLFLIQDILPTSVINDIANENLWNYNWEEQQMQTGWKRRKLLPHEQSPLAEIDNYYNQALDTIETHVGVIFEHKKCWSSFWLDYEGFSCSVHEDGAERNYNPLMAMQIYLVDGDTNFGTVFYYDNQGQQVRYVFPYKCNTGYIMLNHPGQWHGMTRTLQANKIRVSSYTYFGKFSHK